MISSELHCVNGDGKVKLTPRIVGGQPAEETDLLTDLRGVVSLQTYNGEHFCGYFLGFLSIFSFTNFLRRRALHFKCFYVSHLFYFHHIVAHGFKLATYRKSWLLRIVLLWEGNPRLILTWCIFVHLNLDAFALFFLIFVLYALCSDSLQIQVVGDDLTAPVKLPGKRRQVRRVMKIVGHPKFKSVQNIGAPTETIQYDIAVIFVCNHTQLQMHFTSTCFNHLLKAPCFKCHMAFSV